MNTLRKQLEALRDDYEELQKGGALAISMGTLILDLNAILAEQGERESGWLIEIKGEARPMWWKGDSRICWTVIAEHATRFARKQDADEVIIGRVHDAEQWKGKFPFASEHVFITSKTAEREQGEQAPGLKVGRCTCHGGVTEDAFTDPSCPWHGTPSPVPSPAPGAGMREKAIEAGKAAYYSLDPRYASVPKIAEVITDAVLRLCGEGQLREAAQALIKALDDYRLRPHPTSDGNREVATAREALRAALQRTPEPPSREMERKAFVAGAEWNDMLVQPSGCEGFYAQAEAEAARRYGGVES